MKVRDVIRLIEKEGWRHVRTTGSQGLSVLRSRGMEYLVVVEKSKTGYGAYVPDLPGCVAVAETRREVVKLIREGIALHIEALREAGEPIPPPISKSQVVKVRAA